MTDGVRAATHSPDASQDVVTRCPHRAVRCLPRPHRASAGGTAGHPRNIRERFDAAEAVGDIPATVSPPHEQVHHLRAGEHRGVQGVAVPTPQALRRDRPIAVAAPAATPTTVDAGGAR